MSAANTVYLKSLGPVHRKERPAGGTITPGHLIQLTSANTVVVHANAGRVAQKAFALEDELQGKTISDNYAATNRVQYVIAQRGDEVQARLKANENVAIGDALESAGDGTLQKYVASSAGVVEYPNSIVAFALEASNVGTVALLAVEIA